MYDMFQYIKINSFLKRNRDESDVSKSEASTDLSCLEACLFTAVATVGSTPPR